MQIDMGDPKQEAEIELRHLRKTIHALRQELELQQAEKTESVQRSVANAQDEIGQLRKTVAALREVLTAKQLEKDEGSPARRRGVPGRDQPAARPRSRAARGIGKPAAQQAGSGAEDDRRFSWRDCRTQTNRHGPAGRNGISQAGK